MKKRAFLIAVFAIILVLISAVAFATNHTSSNNNEILSQSSSSSSNLDSTDAKAGVDKAYQCLENEVKDKTTLSLQEAVFSTLALGYKKNLDDKIKSEQTSGIECWPKSECKLKDSAQVAMAYKRIGRDSSGVEKWLLSKNSTSSDLTWYVEIDIANHEAAECTLKYDNSERKINVLDDMKLSGNPGNCFSISASGYWLSMKESCFDKEFEISCNQDFITALLYEKKAGGIVYVTEGTHSASSLGTTSEKVSAKCFKSGNSCDYEGSLWAALTLHKSGRDTGAYIPYLLALAENNQRYFPQAFLYILTAGENQYSEVIQNQKQGKYWEIVGGSYNRFYDTSLGMLSLSGSSASELENTKSYLLSIQTKEGCWNNNNIRDTAFILYSGWGKNVPGAGGTGTGSALCGAVPGQSCEIGSECTSAGGRILSNFECSGVGVCCSVRVGEPRCVEQGGILCSSNQKCDGRILGSSDSEVCCRDACINILEEENTCEIFGGECKTSCSINEEEDIGQSCSVGGVCCITKSKGSNLLVWIIVLIILIILVALAIIFRDKLRVWWYKFKGKTKITSIIKPGTPPFSSPPQQYKPSIRTPIRRATGGVVRPPLRRPMPRTSKDSEFEETLKKLKEMSK